MSRSARRSRRRGRHGQVLDDVAHLPACMLYLYGESGTIYYYIHLNNDLTLKNDNRGKCVRASRTQ
jgi:hypothetical protein